MTFRRIAAALGGLALLASSPVFAMTLEEKAGQVLALSFSGTSLDGETRSRLEEIKPGGLILYGKNVESLSQVRSLLSCIRETVRLDLPLMVAVDQEGGTVARIRGHGADFPGNMALGATGDPDLAERQGFIMGRQLKSLGIDLDYAPVVDVNSNSSNPIIGVRSFGDDVAVVSSMGASIIKGFSRARMGCSAKHFPGHGDVDIDSHLGLPVLDRSLESMRALEFPPFRSAVEAGVPAVMTAHIVVPSLTGELPATLSPEAMSLLREELGFEGVVLSDSMGMRAISNEWGVPDAVVMALRAGVDFVLLGADPAFPPEGHREVRDRIVEAVDSGELDKGRLDDAVERILRWKYDMGLSSGEDRPDWVDGSALAEEIASRSVTLIRSDGPPPLRKGDHVTLIWPEKKAVAAEILLRRLSDLGVSGSIELFGGRAVPDVNVDEIKGPVLMGCYDLVRDEPSVSFLRKILEERPDCVSLSMKTPYDLTVLPEAETALACYGDTPPTLKALAAILLGEIRPSGRLPVELPGLYPRGWGVSWSSR
ncbi:MULTISPECIES: beta-N-acetylhexosaminidase [Dethiosulfovibrio]|uniref:Beta-N-acetylhexosaminidase n=2 Tax=Dethiosulfovibrio TaxID=47054 RepID=A0ABS9EMY7_9BACT|nr:MULTISPECIES: beta-N-acetylhexosaminidase [Dethiosulfovibrio]MCF4114255.1 beta-N-acetylhexosaminidase [Dethiosulfovibrio russensis]MCF4142555.1 beta-N-acetylhexosaminidase [Dethiosulfovibrio marinus]MCF4145580.1 beta-N-acetylhexosaminidase [Dethiosulfovibrio acidaminovorans]